MGNSPVVIGFCKVRINFNGFGIGGGRGRAMGETGDGRGSRQEGGKSSSRLTKESSSEK